MALEAMPRMTAPVQCGMANRHTLGAGWAGGQVKGTEQMEREDTVASDEELRVAGTKGLLNLP